MSIESKKASEILGRILLDLNEEIIFSLFDLQEAININYKHTAQNIAAELESDLKQLYEDLESLAVALEIKPMANGMELLVTGGIK